MRKIAFVLIIILAGVSACTKLEDKVLAQVGNEEITVGDFLERYVPKGYPSEEAELEAKMESLNQLIEYKLLVEEARARGYHDDPLYADSFEIAYKEALVDALYYKEVIEKAQASNRELKQFYEADNVILHLRVIHVQSDTMGYIVLSDFTQGVPFDTLAVRYSQHPSSAMGGDIGTTPLSSFFFDEQIFQQLSKIKEGMATSPLPNRAGGYDVFYLEEKTSRENPVPFDDVKHKMRRHIEHGRELRMRDESRERLMEEVSIEYNTVGLDILLKPRNEISPEALSVWTVKVNGEVTDSIGSMLGVYNSLQLGDSLGVPANKLQDIASGFGLHSAMARLALDRGLDRDPIVEKFVKETIDYMISQRLFAEEVEARIHLTPEEIQAYYENNPDEFNIPERRRISIIRTPSSSAAQEALSLLEQGVLFSDVAAQFSDHRQSAQSGGSIGLKRRDDPNWQSFVEQAFTLRVGEFSRSFSVYNGFGIVMVTEIKEGYTKTFAEASGGIERKLRTRQKRELERQLLEELRSRISIEIDEKLLLSVAKMSPTGENAVNQPQ